MKDDIDIIIYNKSLALMIGINVDSRKLQVDVVNINGLGYFFCKAQLRPVIKPKHLSRIMNV